MLEAISNPSRPDVEDANGFTLIEVIVALSVFGFSMMAVFQALTTCAVAAHHTRMLTRSVLMAEKLLVESRLSGISSFSIQEGREGAFSWRIQTSETPAPGLAAFHVKVTWLEQQRPQEYELESLVRMNTMGRGPGGLPDE